MTDDAVIMLAIMINIIIIIIISLKQHSPMKEADLSNIFCIL